MRKKKKKKKIYIYIYIMKNEKRMVQNWLGYSSTVSQYNGKVYCDTVGLRGLNGCGFMLQYNNFIVTRDVVRLGSVLH